MNVIRRVTSNNILVLILICSFDQIPGSFPFRTDTIWSILDRMTEKPVYNFKIQSTKHIIDVFIIIIILIDCYLLKYNSFYLVEA